MKTKPAFWVRSMFLALLLPSLLLLHHPVFAADDDVLQRLGLTQATARESLLGPLTGSIPYHDAAYKAFKVLPAAARAEVVRAGLSWIKAHVAGAEFRESYRRLRETERPAAPEPGAGADDQSRKMRDDMEKSIAEMKKNMAAMDAETRKAMEGVIRAMRAQMERMESGPQKEMLRQAAEASAAENKKRHEAELSEWERRLPADPRVLIKRRIQEFLDLSAGVDFAARLVPRGEHKVFVRGDYEKMPPEWKLCFRAGREATAAARAFAVAWLAELERP